MTAALGLAGMWWLAGALVLGIIIMLFNIWAHDSGFYEKLDE